MNLAAAERLLVEEALRETGSIVGAAELLGITRHGLKRRIIKHRIEWPRGEVFVIGGPDDVGRVGGTT